MPSHLLFTYLRRGLLLWVMVRVTAGVVARTANQGDVPPDVGPVAPLLVVTALAAVDLRRRREWLLLANLGVAPVIGMLLPVCAAMAGELLFFAVRHGRG